MNDVHLPLSFLLRSCGLATLKFQLSTCLIFVALVAVALGWWVDRNSQTEINGKWKYPPDGLVVLGYSSDLEIRPDGTFTQTQSHRTFAETFNGTYRTLDDGTVLFHATEQIKYRGDTDTDTTTIDIEFLCRCAVDSSGYLIVSEDRLRAKFRVDTRLAWESYCPAD